MNQSFKQVFVTNSGTLLASGTTTDLSVGQVGIFDGDTYQATTTPTFFKNKSIRIGWGYPNIPPAAIMSGMFNQNEISQKIAGKRIKNVRVFRAVHPRPEVVTVGWSGDVSDDSTLTVPAGESKSFYLRLTGAPIDKIYSTQGFLRRYVVEGPCIDNCADGCTDSVDCRAIAESLAKKINLDPKVKGLVKASVISECDPAVSVSTVPCYVFTVTICDDGSDTSLGYVQSQYPGTTVTRKTRVGSNTTYSVTKDVNTAPAAVSNAGLTIIPDCPTCPSGYTLVASGFVYEVKRADAGSSGNLTTVKSDYSISGSETGVRLSYENGVSTYILTASAAITSAVGVDQLKFLGESRNSCVITSATTTAWALSETLAKYPKVFRLTVADSVCGTNRLSEIQAAFPDLTVSLVDADGSCVHTYETTVYSQCVPAGCSLDLLQFVAPDSFEGASWEAVPDAALADGTSCKCGIRLESAWVDRVTNECTYGYWPYEADGVHIEISEYDPNYNGAPDKCKLDSTKVRTIQTLVYPQGNGQHVRRLEEKSKELFLKDRAFDPVRREMEGYEFIAKPENFYDQVTIEFDYSYPVGGFSQHYTDSTHLHIFVKEGLGSALVTALNSYIASPEIALDPVVL